MANPASDVVEPGTILGGRYRVERQLGKGGMGSVYLVQHVHTDQQLALKLLHAAVVTDEVALTRFRREARAPARVNSDHVVQVTDADVAPELGGVPFLVMEWLRGQDLEDLSCERGPLPAEEVVLYLRQIARALDKAHPLGIIHRDLKPENLFLTTRDDGTPCVKILDFGIAKLTSGDEAGRLKATGTGQIFGTPLYMSPEQTKAELDKIAPQTDIWALGIIAYRLLAGTEPWSAATLTALIAQIAYEPLPVPSQRGHDLGRDFDAWFAQCCAREPGARFATAGETVAALGRALRVGDEVPAVTLRRSGPGSITRPARDDDGRTAFSATAPAPSSLPSSPGPMPARVRPGPSKLQLGLVGATILVGSAVLAWAYTSRQHVVATPGPAVASSTLDAPATASVTATTQVAPGPSAAPVDVPEPRATASASATATSARPSADVKKPAHPVITAAARAPTAPPASTPAPAATPAPAPTPAKPDDPLGTRH